MSQNYRRARVLKDRNIPELPEMGPREFEWDVRQDGESHSESEEDVATQSEQGETDSDDLAATELDERSSEGIVRGIVGGLRKSRSGTETRWILTETSRAG